MLFLIFFTAVQTSFLKGSLFAMMKEEEDEPQTFEATIKLMSREELEKLILSQRSRLNENAVILSIMTEEEKKSHRILSTPLAQKTIHLILALTQSEKTHKPLTNSFPQLEESQRILKKLTIFDVLKDKDNISENIARKLFRAVLIRIRDHSAFEISHPQPGENKSIFDELIVTHLTTECPVIKIMYPEGSLMECLIQKYLNLRGGFYFVQRIHRSSHLCGLF